jgi:hypothetical protein
MSDKTPHDALFKEIFSNPEHASQNLAELERTQVGIARSGSPAKTYPGRDCSVGITPRADEGPKLRGRSALSRRRGTHCALNQRDCAIFLNLAKFGCSKTYPGRDYSKRTPVGITPVGITRSGLLRSGLLRSGLLGRDYSVGITRSHPGLSRVVGWVPAVQPALSLARSASRNARQCSNRRASLASLPRSGSSDGMYLTNLAITSGYPKSA